MAKKQSKKQIKKKQGGNFTIPILLVGATFVVLFGLSFAIKPVQATNIIIEVDVPFDHSSWDKNFTVLLHQSYVDTEDKAISEANPSFSIPLPEDPEFNSSYTEIRVKNFEGIANLSVGEGWIGRTEDAFIIFNSSEVFNNSDKTKEFTFLAESWADFTVDSVSVNYTKETQGVYAEREYLCFNHTTNLTEMCWNADYNPERILVNVSLAGFEFNSSLLQMKPHYGNTYVKVRIPSNFTVSYAYYTELNDGDNEVSFTTITEGDETYLIVSEILFYKRSFTIFLPLRRLEEVL